MTHLYHPGSILKSEFLNEYGLTVSAAATAMGITRARLNEITHGRRSITAETALLLAKYFDTTPQFWLNLQVNYDLAISAATTKSRLKKIKPARTTVTA